MSEPPHPSPTSGFSVREKLSISVHWSSCWHPASAPAAAALAAGGSALCWCKHEPPSLACAINAPIPLLLLLLVFGLNSQSRCDTELSLTLPDVKFYQVCWFISCFILLTLVLVFPVSLTDRVLPSEISIGPALIGLTCSRVSAVIVLSLPWLSHVLLSLVFWCCPRVQPSVMFFSPPGSLRLTITCFSDWRFGCAVSRCTPSVTPIFW